MDEVRCADTGPGLKGLKARVSAPSRWGTTPRGRRFRFRPWLLPSAAELMRATFLRVLEAREARRLAPDFGALGGSSSTPSGERHTCSCTSPMSPPSRPSFAISCRMFFSCFRLARRGNQPSRGTAALAGTSTVKVPRFPFFTAVTERTGERNRVEGRE
jgi:hypothetical protein